MAVLKHPNLDWDNGVTAPQSIAELVAIADITPFFVMNTLPTLPHPDGNDLVSGGGAAEDTAVGYAS